MKISNYQATPIFAVTKKSIVLVHFSKNKLLFAMKNLASFKNNAAKLNLKEMKAVKGGFSYTVEAQIDICYIGHNGSVNNVYCDRRRRRLGGSH